MLSDMATIAAECIKHPNRRAVWSEQLEKYVCPDTDEGQTVTLDHESRTHPPLTSQFKLVFGTAAGGTLLFVVLCVILTLASGKEPPSLMTELIRGLFSLAQIGFGAVVGLLGGKRLNGEDGQ
jgi:hypothetical protein